jgi:hypothetical protein
MPAPTLTDASWRRTGWIAALVAVTAAVLAFAAAPLSAEEPVAAAADPGRQREFHLTGRVLLPDGGPAAGATVRLDVREAPAEGQWEHEWTTAVRTCDAAGRYDFGPLHFPTLRGDGWERGTVLAALDGYGFDAVSVLFEDMAVEQQRVVYATGPETVCDLALTSPQMIAGNVVGPDGEPLAAARVRLRGVHWQTPSGGFASAGVPSDFMQTATDAAGAFRLSGLPDGASPLVLVEKDGFVSDYEYPRDGEIRCVLQLAGVIEGRVTYGDTGRPAPGLRVSVALWDEERMNTASSAGPSSCTTDRDGRFRLTGLPQSSATVTVETQGALPGFTAEKALNLASSVASGPGLAWKGSFACKTWSRARRCGSGPRTPVTRFAARGRSRP